MKALFIVNTRSGVRKQAGIVEWIRDQCTRIGIEYETAPCGRKEDLDEIIPRAEREGVDVVYAVGGDGTVHEVARRLIGRRVALGILPTGSGNGFARHLGIRSLDLCRNGSIVDIDTAEVDGRAYVGVMGIGFDAIVADRFATAGTRGFRTYARVGLKAFRAFNAEEYEIEAAGRVLKARAYLVAIANSSQYGNDARIAPLASLRDGLLDVVVVKHVSRFALPMMLVRLFRGTFHRARGVTVIQAKEITIRRAAAGPAHLDGEPETLPAVLHVRVRPRSLRVLVPQSVERNSSRI